MQPLNFYPYSISFLLHFVLRSPIFYSSSLVFLSFCWPFHIMSPWVFSSPSTLTSCARVDRPASLERRYISCNVALLSAPCRVPLPFSQVQASYLIMYSFATSPCRARGSSCTSVHPSLVPHFSWHCKTCSPFAPCPPHFPSSAVFSWRGILLSGSVTWDSLQPKLNRASRSQDTTGLLYVAWDVFFAFPRSSIKPNEALSVDSTRNIFSCLNSN